MAEQRQLIDTARTEVELLKSQPLTEEAIERLIVQLEQLPKEHPEVEMLQREIAEVRAKKDARDALLRRLQDELADVANKLKQLDDSTKPTEKPHRKKKGKKSQPEKPAEHTAAQRKERIELLNSAIGELDNQIIPRLAKIENEAIEGDVKVDGLKPHQQHAADLVKRLSVSKTNICI